MHFWTEFALITLFENYFEFFVSWVPLYSFFKLLLLWYIIHPSTKGATVVFENFLEPRFQEKIAWAERALLGNSLSGMVWESMTEQLSLAVDVLSDDTLETMQTKVRDLTLALEREREKRAAIRVLAIGRRPQQPELEDDIPTAVTVNLNRVTSAEFEFEMLSTTTGPRTPSPTDAPMRAPTSANRKISADHLGRRHSAEVTPVRSAAAALRRNSADVPSSSGSRHRSAGSPQPSYLPTRGFHRVESPLISERNNEEEDVQDATLRFLEQNESPSASRHSSLDISTVSTVVAENNTSPPSSTTRRFSWMSPRWPTFWAQEQTPDDQEMHSSGEEYIEDDDEVENEEVVEPVTSMKSFGGPVTRSRARQAIARRSSQQQPQQQEVSEPTKKKKRGQN
jgi:hypothetical protein